MHEILTLQFGQRANYLATHFWNLQESYFTYTPDTEPSIVDHDIHFRPGIGSDGSDTYTPRTLIYDLKGGFGNLKKINALYDDGADINASALWEGTPAKLHQPPIPVTQYQKNLDSGLPTHQLRPGEVRYWSDFNRVYFHPRSIVQLNEYSLNSELAPFESWSNGDELFRTVDKEVDLLDRDLRPFAEEADHMQGFQIFSGVDDAWGGFAERYIDAIRDEFGKKCLWVWAIEDGSRRERQKMLSRAGNSARSLRSIAQHASAYMRLSTSPSPLPSYVHLDNASEWASAALLASAVETATLPTRLRSGHSQQRTMDYFESVLNTNGGQNLFQVGSSIREGEEVGSNAPVTETRPESEALLPDVDLFPQTSRGLFSSASRTPSANHNKHVYAQVSCRRHRKRSLLLGPPTTVSDHRERLMRRYNDECIIEAFRVPLIFPQLETFPSALVSLPDHRPQDGLEICSTITNAASMKQHVLDLRDLVIRDSRVIEIEEREGLYNDLTELSSPYAFGWEEDTDSDGSGE